MSNSTIFLLFAIAIFVICLYFFVPRYLEHKLSIREYEEKCKYAEDKPHIEKPWRPTAVNGYAKSKFFTALSLFTLIFSLIWEFT